jgi:hypothetical protein
MRRNMDLVRSLMLRLEELPMEIGDAITIQPGCKELAGIEGTDAEVNHHLEMLRDMGLLECPSGGQPMFGIVYMGLTWTGHDFTDSVRNNNTWKKTKSVAEQAGGWTVGLLLEIAKTVIKAEAGKYLPGL